MRELGIEGLEDCGRCERAGWGRTDSGTGPSMIQVMKRGLFSCLLIASWVALGADSSALEILKRTAATYPNLRSYKFRVRVQTVRGADRNRG